MRRMRLYAKLALALLVSVFAVAPHQHEGLTDDLLRDRVEQVGKCSDPAARHFHASKTSHAQPCVACARQHAGGTLQKVAAGVIPAVVVDLPRQISAHASAAATLVTHLRGPPA